MKIERMNSEIETLRAQFCPFNFKDLKRVVEIAYHSGKGTDWAFETIKEYEEDSSLSLSKIDICYVVLLSVLQEAESEIERAIGFEIRSDACYDIVKDNDQTHYEFSQEGENSLADALTRHPSEVDKFSSVTKYWLAQVGINLRELKERGDRLWQ